jgi:hypothetical protein
MNRYLPLLIAVGIMLSLLAGCDYPQAGFFSLVGKDAAGKTVLRLPFAVEEEVDDTEMTTGYKLLLPAPPQDGTPCVVEVQVQNGTDFTRRSWNCAIAAADTRAGDVHIDLTHADERMSFIGAYRRDAFSPVVQLAAELFTSASGESNRLTFSTELPKVPGAEAVVQWDLVSIEKNAFEQAIGAPLAKAKRNPAAKVEQGFLDAALLAEVMVLQQQTALAQASAAAQPAKPLKPAAKAKPKPGGKNTQPPTLGGRSGNRPR